MGYTVGKLMGSSWLSHVFKSWLENMTLLSWPHDFSLCIPPSFEICCHALFITGLVCTVAITKTKSLFSNIIFTKWALLGGLVLAKPLCQANHCPSWMSQLCFSNLAKFCRVIFPTKMLSFFFQYIIKWTRGVFSTTSSLFLLLKTKKLLKIAFFSWHSSLTWLSDSFSCFY